MSEADRRKHTDEALALLQDGLARLREAEGLPDALLGLTEELNVVLTGLGRDEEAEQVVRQTVDQFDAESAPRGWLLHLFALRHAVKRRDYQKATEDMLAALAWIDQGLAQAAAMADAVAFLAPYSDAVEELVGIACRLGSQDVPLFQSVARIAADVIAAPVLTARVRGSLGLPSPTVMDTAEELGAIGAFHRETPASFIQTVKLGDEIELLITKVHEDGVARSTMRQLPLKLEDVRGTLRRLDFRLRRLSPNVQSLALEKTHGWTELADALGMAIGDLPSGTPLCVVPGALSSLAFSLTFGATHPLCFAPSLRLLLALRERRRRLPAGMEWRPQHLFDFAVWRFGDKPAVSDALNQAVVDGSNIAREHGLTHQATVGTEGDGAALLAGLKAADVARIACHGRILPDEAALDLLVSADGLLPPASAAGLAGDEAKGHILGWQRLAEVGNAAPVVFSSACDSGAAILHKGGERLGLERPLFAAGTATYIAPQWPVPVMGIQQFMSMMLAEYLRDSGRSLAEILMTARAQAIAAGLSPLAVHAPAVFGDGL